MLIPVTGYRLPLGPFWYVFIFLVIAGASNGVNLTDGLDGLAAGTAIISLFTFTTMAVLAVHPLGRTTPSCEARRSSTSRSSAPR